MLHGLPLGVSTIPKKMHACIRMQSFSNMQYNIEAYQRGVARVPTLEGYKRPEKAPLPEDLTRERFHQFMMGRPNKVPVEFKTSLIAFCAFSWVIGLTAFTFNKMKPDDFEWIEEQRNKAEAYKEKMLKQQQLEKELQLSKNQ